MQTQTITVAELKQMDIKQLTDLIEKTIFPNYKIVLDYNSFVVIPNDDRMKKMIKRRIDAIKSNCPDNDIIDMYLNLYHHNTDPKDFNKYCCNCSYSTNSENSIGLTECKHCYDCNNCKKSTYLDKCVDCVECHFSGKSRFCYECQHCTNCVECEGLYNAINYNNNADSSERFD